MTARRLRLLRDAWGALGVLVLTATALCLWTQAGEAQIKVDPASVRQSTESLSAAGPWLGLLLVLGGAAYLEIQRRLQRTELREEITKRVVENLELRQQLEAQQEALVACLRENATMLLQHSKESNVAFGRAAQSIERLADKLGGLEIAVRERLRGG